MRKQPARLVGRRRLERVRVASRITGAAATVSVELPPLPPPQPVRAPGALVHGLASPADEAHTVRRPDALGAAGRGARACQGGDAATGGPSRPNPSPAHPRGCPQRSERPSSHTATRPNWRRVAPTLLLQAPPARAHITSVSQLPTCPPNRRAQRQAPNGSQSRRPKMTLTAGFGHQK